MLGLKPCHKPFPEADVTDVPSTHKLCYSGDCKFTRDGVAYDYLGQEVQKDVPRMTHYIDGKLVHAILLERTGKNLLPPDVSRELTSPYTTGVLSGTYTFQCRGDGSFIISGGAEGEVSKDSPKIVNINNETVTITPLTTSTLNQISEGNHLSSWALGGAERPDESLSINGDKLNPDEGTIEIDFYLTRESSMWQLLRGEKVRIYYLASEFRFSIGSLSTPPIHKSVLLNGFNRITARYNKDGVSLVINGNLDTMKETEGITGFIGTEEDIKIGQIYAYPFNGLIRNIVISDIYRSDEDVQARAASDTIIVDKHCQLVAPLEKNLNSYRVVSK